MAGGPTATLEPLAPPARAIDPRIRARRIEVRRDEGHRRLARLVDIGVVTVVALAFLAAMWTPLLDVDEVRVDGAAHTGAAVVLEQAEVGIGDRLVSVDLQALGRRIVALPWVREVAVRRGVDGVVTIEVTERTAVAVLGTGPSGLLVDRDGRILGPAADAPDVGPVMALTGVGPTPAPGFFLGRESNDALLVAERVAIGAPGTLATLAADGLVARLTQGGEVRFGDSSQLAAKVRSLRTVVDQVDLTCLALLDLSLPGTPLLTREEGCS